MPFCTTWWKIRVECSVISWHLYTCICNNHSPIYVWQHIHTWKQVPTYSDGKQGTGIIYMRSSFYHGFASNTMKEVNINSLLLSKLRYLSSNRKLSVALSKRPSLQGKYTQWKGKKMKWERKKSIMHEFQQKELGRDAFASLPIATLQRGFMHVIKAFRLAVQEI